jgi:hypothetical protein
VHEGDHYVVNGMFDLAAVGDLGELSFPGRVVDHNGELDGQPVIDRWLDRSLPRCSS